MNFRTLSALAAAACTLLFAPSAQAAVTVFGGGAAQYCFNAADEGITSTDYLFFCNEALAGQLTDHDRAATYINRGIIRLHTYQAVAATADFNAGLAINPNIGEGYVDRGAALVMRHEYAQAIADINKGLELGTREAYRAYYNRAMAAEGLGNLQGAYNDYRKALELEPGFTRAADELKRFKIVDQPNG